MAITNNVDYILTYDEDRPVIIGRALSADAPLGNEHAVQCVVAEVLRDVLATGITVDEWNNMPEPEPWQTWWAARQALGHTRAALNVSAAKVPLLTLSELAQAAAIVNTLFEIGYVAYMNNISQANRITFTRTGGL